MDEMFLFDFGAQTESVWNSRWTKRKISNFVSQLIVEFKKKSTMPDVFSEDYEYEPRDRIITQGNKKAKVIEINE